MTAFTDGGPGLRSIPTEAGCKKPPIAEWVHIAMPLQHPKQAESGLSAGTPGRMQANAVIVPEVERLHWRIWNDKAKYARRTLELVRKVMHVFQGERSHRTMAAPSSRKLWRALCFPRSHDRARASSSTKALFSDGSARKSTLSRLFTAGNFASLMRRSTAWRSWSISSSSASRSR